jgi:hypothetical protein
MVIAAYIAACYMMINLWIVPCLGIVISFLGQLPLGNLAVTATQIHKEESTSHAWQFAGGVALVELLYLRLSLLGTTWLQTHSSIFRWLEWIAVLVFALLGLLSLLSAVRQAPEKKGYLINNSLPRFLLGMALSAANAAQIPFWFFWSTYLLSNHLIHASVAEHNLFAVGAGMGTLLGLGLYIHGGGWLIRRFQLSNKFLNIFLGIVFLLSALIQFLQIIF